MCVRQGSGGCEGKQAIWKKEAEHTEAGSAGGLQAPGRQQNLPDRRTEQGANEPEAAGEGGRGPREGTATAGKIAPQQVKELRAPTLGLRGPPGEPYSL